MSTVEQPSTTGSSRTSSSVGDATEPSSIRLAFVGQSVYFEQCSLAWPVGDLEPTFIDFRAGAEPERLIAQLRRLDPDVVLVFRPEIIPTGLFAQMRAVTIGYLTEPVPRGRSASHPDLLARMQSLRQVDVDNFDRIISFDPLIADTVNELLTVWRSLPLPIEDSLFMDVRERADPPRFLFLGRSTQHREAFLAPVKRGHRVTHIGHGLFGADLRRMLAETDLQLNLHNNPYPTFENRVAIALASGHLVVSEPISPRHDLRPGHDYLEIETSEELRELVDQLERSPGAYVEVQHSGRTWAEQHRASRIYPELIQAALAHVAEEGGRPRRSG